MFLQIVTPMRRLNYLQINNYVNYQSDFFFNESLKKNDLHKRNGHILSASACLV